MSRKIFIILFCLLSHLSNAKKESINLSVSEIPEQLKKDANAIIRYSNTEIIIENSNKIKYQERYAITILNKDAAHFAQMQVYYSNMVKIKSMQAFLYHESGKLIEKIKSKNIKDISSMLYSSYVFHNDSRYKSFNFHHKTYPYTVEFIIEKEIKSLFFLPDWRSLNTAELAVENTSLFIEFPTSLNIRYKEYLMPEKGLTKNILDDKSNNKTSINWILQNIKAHKYEKHSKSESFISPSVIFGPSEFQFFNYTGNMDSWENFSKFYYELNEGQDNLPENVKIKIKDISENTKSNEEAIQSILEYMQETTRYVANEYGIAGWQTFGADHVAKNGYGDCKGLTNYMMVMLKEANIESYPVLIYAGEDEYLKLEETFPVNAFNHIILCVPNDEDSIWIECTSPNYKAGYLGSFTQGRKGLLVKKDGGGLCETPYYGKDKTFKNSKYFLNFEKNADDQQITLNTKYSGIIAEPLYQQLKTSSAEDLNKSINKKYAFPTYKTLEYTHELKNNKFLPLIDEHAVLKINGLANQTLKRTFINLGWLENPMIKIKDLDYRTSPIVIKQSFSVSDTIQIKLPKGYILESAPQSLEKEFNFGSLKFSIIQDKNEEFIFIRTYEQNRGIFDHSEFENFALMEKLFNGINRDLNLVFINPNEDN